MRTAFPRRATAGLGAAALVVLSAGLAHADTVSNNLDNTVDAVAEVMSLNVGTAGSTGLYVTPANGDGKNGCNLTASSTLTIGLASSDPSVATVNPSSVTFASCGDTKQIAITPLTAGSTTIIGAQISNNTAGSFDLSGVTFKVNVANPAPANTAPRVTVNGVTGGASYAKGSVPAATCAVTDAEDGNSSFPAGLSAISGPYAADGIGDQTASCSYTDAGGLTAVSSLTYSITDPSAPVITSALNPATPNGANGWYTSDVALDWTVSEPESPSSLSTTGCADTTVSADQQATDYSCAATSAGGSTGPVTVSIKRDAAAPTVIVGAPSGTTGSNGWYTSDVSVTYSAADATSGVAGSPSAIVTTSGEGNEVVAAGPTFTDNAGNSTTGASKTFKVDLTNPTATFSADLGSSYFGSVLAAPTCTAVDTVSGPAGCTVTGYNTTVGTHTLTATATDNAGRTGTATQTYEVKAWTMKGFYAPIDMGGVLNTVKGGSAVPAKFNVFAGTTEITDAAQITMSAKKVTCSSSAPTDDIEVLASGGTALRYDTTSKQFVYTWKTPTGAGTCYALTATAADGSTTTGLFKIK